MATTLKTGDKVAWETSQGETHGVVEAKVTATTTIKGHTAKATKQEPQYKVKSDNTGAEAIHKPAGLHKR
jgi:plastocyanin